MNQSDLPNEIQITGRIASGKDTLAEAIAARFDYSIVSVGRLIAVELGEHLNVPAATIMKEKDAYRPRIQNYANARRAEDPEYWVKKYLAEVHGRRVINPSCRFIVESELAMERGAVVIRVEVDERIRWFRLAGLYPNHTDVTDRNPAEGEIDFVPYHLAIDGTTPLEALVDAFVLSLCVWRRQGSKVFRPHHLQTAVAVE